MKEMEKSVSKESVVALTALVINNLDRKLMNHSRIQ
jgi:hypothetical protein